MIVYKIVNHVNRKEYVGITGRTVSERWSAHLNSCRKVKLSTRALYNAMKLYGQSNFTIHKICNASSMEELKYLECIYIILFRTIAPYGYNLTKGGDGVNGYKHTEETKRLHSISQKGYRHTPEAIEKIRVASTGRRHTKESIEKIIKKQKGRKKTVEHINKISIGRKGKGLNNRNAAKRNTMNMEVYRG